MDLNDKLFSPPVRDLMAINARVGKLPPVLQRSIRLAGDALSLGDLETARGALANALALAPGQTDVLRLYAMLLARVGNLRAAVANFEAALRAEPQDALGYCQYARACEDAGEIDAALHIREHAAQLLPMSPTALADLGDHLARHAEPLAALPILERATALAPDYAPAFLKLGDALVSCGRIDAGAAAMRRAIAIQPSFVVAWLNLVNVKTVPITALEMNALRRVSQDQSLAEIEQTVAAFALGAALERSERYTEAFDVLAQANNRRRRERGDWDADQFAAMETAVAEAFDAPHAEAADRRLGDEVIFIVGMPRSGTTLVEQIIGSHSQVEGAGELNALVQVLTEESARLSCRYPGWVGSAASDDWTRLGQRYLELTEPERKGHRRFTDKMPSNWRALGAIRAMLPGAHVVAMQRDPLETCWSCYKQYFMRGWSFTNDFRHLACFYAAFDRAVSRWVKRDPSHVRAQSYERLTESPEPEVRALLDFCGLGFEPGCLAPHRLKRTIQTLSAAQVMEPIHRHTGVARAYGKLLNPLRVAIGQPETTDLPGDHCET